MKTPREDARLRELLQAWNEIPPPRADLGWAVQAAVARQRGRGGSWWARGPFRFGLGGDAAWLRVAGASVALGALLGIAAVEWRRARAQADMPGQYLRWIAPAATAIQTARS